MSLILEALKKAERQHKMGEVPGIGATHHDEIQKNSKLFGIFLLGVVAVGMLFLGIYLGEEEPVQQVDEREAPAIELPLPDSMQPAVQLESAERSVEASRPVIQIQKIVPRHEPEPAAKPESRITEPVIERSVSEPAKSPDIPKPDQSVMPAKPINQLPDGFVDNLPPLNIDIHSYAERSERSYVLINMEKYREGDYLTEGPFLSEILPDGVVLEHMGERFILPIGNY